MRRGSVLRAGWRRLEQVATAIALDGENRVWIG